MKVRTNGKNSPKFVVWCYSAMNTAIQKNLPCDFLFFYVFWKPTKVPALKAILSGLKGVKAIQVEKIIKITPHFVVWCYSAMNIAIQKNLPCDFLFFYVFWKPTKVPALKAILSGLKGVKAIQVEKIIKITPHFVVWCYSAMNIAIKNSDRQITHFSIYFKGKTRFLLSKQ